MPPVPKKSLKQVLASNRKQSLRSPLWRGPCVDGITFSLLSRYLTDRERFRVYVMEGLAPAPQFSHRLEYGNLWHACEEAHAAGNDWRHALTTAANNLSRQYPTAVEQVQHWMTVCRLQFPVYVDFWAKSEHETTGREHVEAEHGFKIPLYLPSGRLVLLRGKRDSVYSLQRGAGKGLWLQENKTKGDVDALQLERHLTFDLQTMMYIAGMRIDRDSPALVEARKEHSIRGVCYNVIRRPLSGGRHTIRQTQKETLGAYYERLGGLIAGEPEYFFMRWEIPISEHDVERFLHRCLMPLLENVCDDYEWWYYCFRYQADPFNYSTRSITFPAHQLRHYQHPFGVRNTLDEGGSTDLDEYLATGSELGLVRLTNLYPELSNE